MSNIFGIPVPAGTGAPPAVAAVEKATQGLKKLPSIAKSGVDALSAKLVALLAGFGIEFDPDNPLALFFKTDVSHERLLAIQKFWAKRNSVTVDDVISLASSFVDTSNDDEPSEPRTDVAIDESGGAGNA